MRKIFGTDGIRGVANQFPLTPENLVKIAQVTGREFRRGDHRHMVLIGKDTRLSGYLVESALMSGFISIGMDVVLVGPLPTPAIAMLTRSLRADLGVIISASHNPFYDNGIKFFGPDGFKLMDSIEMKIEASMNLNCTTASPVELGHAQRLDDAPGRYIEYVKNTFPKQLRLDGLRIVIDCANGAAYKVAPRVLWELGAEVIPVGVMPNGVNINEKCGATSPELLCHSVIQYNAQVGIALDGDGDRVVIADENGELVHGDHLLGLIAAVWKNRGLLKGEAIVGTVMSNLGLERYLSSHNIALIRSAVGDRYVMDAMIESECNIGGEQSGHIIFKDHMTTGDGLVAALQFLAILLESGLPASAIGRPFKLTPQVLKNIPVKNPAAFLSAPQIQDLVIAAEKEIDGRLLIRRSGTEPLIRIMAEGDDLEHIESLADRLAENFLALRHNP